MKTVKYCQGMVISRFWWIRHLTDFYVPVGMRSKHVKG